METYFATHTTLYTIVIIGSMIVGMLSLLVALAGIASDNIDQKSHPKIIYKIMLGLTVGLLGVSGVGLAAQPQIEAIRDQHTLAKIQRLKIQQAKCQAIIDYVKTQPKSKNYFEQIQVNAAEIAMNQQQINYLNTKLIHHKAPTNSTTNNEKPKHTTAQNTEHPHVTFIPAPNHSASK